jgi:hypothetical protein
VHPLGDEERRHHEGVTPLLWNVVGVIRPVVRDGRLGPPEVRRHDRLGLPESGRVRTHSRPLSCPP